MRRMNEILRYAPVRELIRTRLREFIREPEVIFWVYGFPVLLAVGLGIAFRGTPQQVIHVGVVAGERADEIAAAMKEEDGLVARLLSPEDARNELIRGRVAILVEFDGETQRYTYDPTRQDTPLARARVDDAIQRAAGRADPVTVEDENVTEPGARYIDFLFPGLLGMNLMGGGLFGVGFVIVDMRVRKLLKRFLATPMRGSDFFVGILASRMLFLVPEMLFLLAVAMLGFGVPMRGSWIALGGVTLLSALCFSGMGLLVATRARKLETASGLMNLVMLPMWLLSGIFFSTDRFPDLMQPFIHALPLTATNDALRAVMLDGSSFWSQGSDLLILLAWGALSFLVSLKLFRWI